MDSGPAPDALYRISTLEHDVREVQSQLRNYVPQRENDLHLATIGADIKRLEQDLLAVKSQHADRAAVERIERDLQEVRQNLRVIQEQLVIQDRESRDRDNKQREKQDQLQINVLRWIVVTGIGVIVTIFVGIFLAVIQHWV